MENNAGGTEKDRLPVTVRIAGVERERLLALTIAATVVLFSMPGPRTCIPTARSVVFTESTPTEPWVSVPDSVTGGV